MSRRMWILAGCWLLVNLASISHSAWAFAQLERAGWWWLIGVVAAVGTDAGMAALTWISMERRRKGASVTWPVAGIVIAGAVVAFANIDHAQDVAGSLATLGWWLRVRVVALSLVLPLLTVLMSALVEGEHAAAHVPAKATRTRKAVAPAMPEQPRKIDPADFAALSYPPATHERKRTATGIVTRVAAAPGTSTADAARAIAAAEPELRRVDIARRLGVHPAQVSRALNGATMAGAAAARNGQRATSGEVG